MMIMMMAGQNGIVGLLKLQSFEDQYAWEHYLEEIIVLKRFVTWACVLALPPFYIDFILYWAVKSHGSAIPYLGHCGCPLTENI